MDAGEARIGIYLRLRPPRRSAGRVVAGTEGDWVEFSVPKDAAQGCEGGAWQPAICIKGEEPVCALGCATLCSVGLVRRSAHLLRPHPPPNTSTAP